METLKGFLEPEHAIPFLTWKGYQDVKVEHGMLFAGGAGGQKHRARNCSSNKYPITDNHEIRTPELAKPY